MSENENWTPDNAAAIEQLLRRALADDGTIGPDELPSHIRAHLKDYAAGKTDIDSYIKMVMAKLKKEQG